MSNSRRQRAKELFHRALDRSPEEHDSFLKDACGGDPLLEQEVRSLLAKIEEYGVDQLTGRERTFLDRIAELIADENVVGHMAGRMAAAGADGLVLFNRFLQPDIHIDDLETKPKLELSTSFEMLLPLPDTLHRTKPKGRIHC